MLSLRLPALVAAFLLTFVTGCAAPPASPGEVGQTRQVQILHTNDFHGRILPQVVGGDTLGGVAFLAAHFDSARVRFDGPTLLLSAGDVMQGTALSNLTWGRASVDLYNLMGYTAAALGNHEFDWGVDTLRARVAESRFPWLAANLFLEGEARHPEWVQPWVVVEEAGVRIGVVGVTLSTTPEVVMAGMTAGLRFEDEVVALDRAIPQLRAEGVDAVIAVGHVGAVCETPGEGPDEPSSGCVGRAVEILESLEHLPDLFLAGHTHLRNLTQVRGVPLSQNPAYSHTFSLTQLGIGPQGGDGALASPPVTLLRQELRTPLAREVDPDTAIQRVAERWTRDVEPLLAREVATLAQAMTNEDRQPIENPAGNLLADAHRDGTAADVGLVNNGALRRGLPAGSVTWGVLYEFQPFQNDLVVLEISGEILRRTLEHGLTDDGRPRAHVSGVRVVYDRARPRGGRILEIRREDGTLVRDEDLLTLSTTEFVVRGGDGFTMLSEGTAHPTGIVDLDALIRYLERFSGPVPSPELGRWQLRSR